MQSVRARAFRHLSVACFIPNQLSTSVSVVFRFGRSNLDRNDSAETFHIIIMTEFLSIRSIYFIEEGMSVWPPENP